jgi:hypothetical protein
MEVTREPRKAEWAIAVTESGRVSVFRHRQLWKRHLGIFVKCDGVSNVTEDNSEQNSKTESPRMETEEGTVNDVKRLQL